MAALAAFGAWRARCAPDPALAAAVDAAVQAVATTTTGTGAASGSAAVADAVAEADALVDRELAFWAAVPPPPATASAASAPPAAPSASGGGQHAEAPAVVRLLAAGRAVLLAAERALGGRAEREARLDRAAGEAEDLEAVLALHPGGADASAFTAAEQALMDAKDEHIDADFALQRAIARKRPDTDGSLKQAVGEAKVKVQRCQRAVEVARLELLGLADKHFPEMFLDPALREALDGLDPTLAALDRPGRTLDVYAPLEWADAIRPGASRHAVHLVSFDGAPVVLKEFDLNAADAKENATQLRELVRQVFMMVLIR